MFERLPDAQPGESIPVRRNKFPHPVRINSGMLAQSPANRLADKELLPVRGPREVIENHRLQQPEIARALVTQLAKDRHSAQPHVVRD